MKNQAFTLIELLVVVLIIGILAAIAVPQYQKAVDKSRLSEIIGVMKHIKDMQEVYFLANGNYASNCKELGVDINGYSLDDNNNLIETDKKYFISCHWYTPKVSAQLRTNVPSGYNLMAIEWNYDHSETDPGIRQCWSRDDSRYKNMCTDYCGIDVVASFNANGSPNGYSCNHI